MALTFGLKIGSKLENWSNKVGRVFFLSGDWRKNDVTLMSLDLFKTLDPCPSVKSLGPIFLLLVNEIT